METQQHNQYATIFSNHCIHTFINIDWGIMCSASVTYKVPLMNSYFLKESKISIRPWIERVNSNWICWKTWACITILDQTWKYSFSSGSWVKPSHTKILQYLNLKNFYIARESILGKLWIFFLKFFVGLGGVGHYGKEGRTGSAQKKHEIYRMNSETFIFLPSVIKCINESCLVVMTVSYC